MRAFGKRAPLDLGVFVTPVGGDFELRVARPDYDSPPAVAQTDAASGAVVRELPASALRGWRGLRRFFSVTVATRTGKVVATRALPFCPGGFGLERVTDEGRPIPHYPDACAPDSPFVRGTVWGLDAGWASGVAGEGSEGSGVPSVRLLPGRYVARVRIAAPYDALLGVRPEHAEVTVNLRVKAAPRQAPKGDYVAVSGPARRLAGVPVPTLTDPDPLTLPDLVALPPWNVEAVRRGRRDYLSFASTPWNAGPAPLVVEGFRRPAEAVMDGYQYFYDAGGAPVGRAPVGALEFDARPGHAHWHFLQFVRYALLDESRQAVVRSRKQAFCLAPTDAIDLTGPGAEWTPWDSGLATMCGAPRSIWVRETLFAGWGDTYHQGTPGQAIDVTTVRNGRYWLSVEVNPLGALKERSTANNVELRLVTLRGKPGARRVTVAPWHSITD